MNERVEQATDKNEKRSFNDGGWYWVSKVILDQYAKKLKPSGLTVYDVLAYFSNSESQTCFPTIKGIANKLGISRSTVKRKISLLKAFDLIKVGKSKNRNMYRLKKVYGPEMDHIGLTADPIKGSRQSTNNNKLTRNINNIDSDDKIIFLDDASYKDIKLETKEDLLALDTAKALNDLKSLPLYLKYAHQVPEYVIREALSWIKMIPSENIKKSRAALFNYIIQKYVKENLKDHGN